MKTKLAIVGVIVAILPNLSALAGESQASSSASTMNQSSGGNEQSSESSHKASSSATTTVNSSAASHAESAAGTENINGRGTVVNPRIPANRPAAEPRTLSARSTRAGSAFTAKANFKTRFYYPGYRKPGFEQGSSIRKAKTAHWQTRVWR